MRWNVGIAVPTAASNRRFLFKCPRWSQIIADGTQALHFFDQLAQHAHVACPDLLLLDLHLPGHHGTELLQRFKAIPRCAGITVIIVSASVEPTDRTETLALGADAFFQKPFRFAEYMELGHLIKQLVFGGAEGRGVHSGCV